MAYAAIVFGYASIGVSLYGYIPYVIDTIKGGPRPDPIAWFIWSVEYGVMVFALWFKHVPPLALGLVGVQWLGVLVVFTLSLWRNGEKKLTCASIAKLLRGTGLKTRLTLGAVGAGLVAWWLLQDSLAALLISLAIEATGIVFVVVKTLRDPASETYSVWACAASAGVLGTLAVAATPGAGAVAYLYPAVLAVINFAVVAAKLVRSETLRYVVREIIMN